MIPKDINAPIKHLQNWRPITLLNVNYKIPSKAIAKRTEPTLTKLVHPDQTNFIRRRRIRENIRLISNVMEGTKKNSTGVLISVDFQKVSDALEWSCIQAVLKADNFCEGVLKWIHVFYTDMESAVVDNRI